MGKGKSGSRGLILATAFVMGAMFGAGAMADSYTYTLSGGVGTYAVPDGNAAALSAAVTAANTAADLTNKIIISLGAGTYELARTLTINTPLEIRGNGTATLDGYQTLSHEPIPNSTMTINTATINGLVFDTTGAASATGLRLMNFIDAIVVKNSGDTTISQTVATRNDGAGIHVSGTGSVRIEGNLIGDTGFDARKDALQGGNWRGVSVDANKSTTITDNTVSGNFYGISAAGGSTVHINSNRIGVDETGASSLANIRDGIVVQGNSSAFIGDGGRNIVSGNGGTGIVIDGSAATIRDNYIGVIAGGPADPLDPANSMGNSGDGIRVTNANGAIIAGNVIATNNGNGVALSSANNSIIKSNTISENSGDGIQMMAGSGNLIGVDPIAHDPATDGNTIDHNNGRGINTYKSAEPNGILGNSIFDNQSLGIDLGNNGVTNNIGNDALGPQCFPTILEQIVENGINELRVNFETQRSGPFFLEFFANASPDFTGYGEGETWLGRIQVDGPGIYKFDLPTDLPANQPYFTATATQILPASESGGSTYFTSEFSQTFPAAAVPLPSAALMVSVALAGLGGVRFIRRRRRVR